MRGSWKPNRTATYWPPILLAITAFLSRPPGLLNRGPGGPASLGHVPQSSIFSPTHLISKSSDLQLSDFLSSPGLYNNLTSTLLPTSVTISHSFNPSTVKVIISWYSSTGCTCYLHRCISYFDSPARSEVNIQQKALSLGMRRSYFWSGVSGNRYLFWIYFILY